MDPEPSIVQKCKTMVDEYPAILFDHAQHTNAFSKVYSVFQSAYTLHQTILQILAKWKRIYDELVENNGKKEYLYCLDAFFFQYKLFQFEMEHYAKYIAFVNHHMYGDYYRLHSSLTEYAKSHLSESRSNSPITSVGGTSKENVSIIVKHKEMEPFFEYKLPEINQLYRTVILQIDQIYTDFNSKQRDLIRYKNTTAAGYSIFPFLNTLKYENSLQKEQIAMYQNTLLFFYESHISILNELSLKMRELESKLNGHFQILIGEPHVSIEPISTEDVAPPPSPSPHSESATEEIHYPVSPSFDCGSNCKRGGY
jgi:hypothetical protein